MKARKYHHGDLKNALLRAGIDILEEEGLPGLSLRAIAAKAGVSHAAPRNHFDGLNGLLAAIAAEGYRRHKAYMQEGITPESSRPEQLAAAMHGYVRFARENPALFALMFSPVRGTLRDPDLTAAARESYAVLKGIAERIDWDKASGPDAALRTEMMLWSFVHGYAHLYASQEAGTARCGGIAPPDVATVIPGFSYID
ncbi:TetR/AcrR family transcriptional regulator [Paracoccus caeni]|uniref:TetR/AcrR family transcriptional regulator n=1 Tax=Paracoccus caeni TaxID=657651 RepID=A0A934W175_9RHOB|nr:TetR/AcrR family transcriptional regulator [Paracoccus caeni]MBK4217113.1 TetR/AcrR family transcriptional regulator [Paracoccus caeni]